MKAKFVFEALSREEDDWANKEIKKWENPSAEEKERKEEETDNTVSAIAFASEFLQPRKLPKKDEDFVGLSDHEIEITRENLFNIPKGMATLEDIFKLAKVWETYNIPSAVSVYEVLSKKLRYANTIKEAKTIMYETIKGKQKVDDYPEVLYYAFFDPKYPDYKMHDNGAPAYIDNMLHPGVHLAVSEWIEDYLLQLNTDDKPLFGIEEFIPDLKINSEPPRYNGYKIKSVHTGIAHRSKESPREINNYKDIHKSKTNKSRPKTLIPGKNAPQTMFKILIDILKNEGIEIIDSGMSMNSIFSMGLAHLGFKNTEHAQRALKIIKQYGDDIISSVDFWNETDNKLFIKFNTKKYWEDQRRKEGFQD